VIMNRQKCLNIAVANKVATTISLLPRAGEGAYRADEENLFIKKKYIFALLFMVPLFLFSIRPSFAETLPDDQEQINVEGGWGEIDLQNGVFVLHKPVVVTQGSRRLDSDTLTIYRTKAGELEKIIATGNPARFQGLTKADPKSPVMHASAKNITWDAKAEKLILTTNAYVEQAGDIITGPLIEYYLKDNKVMLQQNQQHQGRTKIVLQPRPGSSLNLQGKSKR